MSAQGSLSRSLLIVGGSGVGVALVCFLAAHALGPVSFPHGVNISSSDFSGAKGPEVAGGGPQGTRTLDWSGGDELTLQMPAKVIYTQGPLAKVEVSGPQRSIELVELDGDTLKLNRRVRDLGEVTVRITAPAVNQFSVQGASELTLHGYDQDRLEISISGAAEIKADGRAREAEVHISGAGDVDLGALPTESLEVHISGVGETVGAPSQRAEVHIAGAGDVKLRTHPPEVESHIFGPGSITYEDAAPSRPAAPVPPPTPRPPEPPKTAA